MKLLAVTACPVGIAHTYMAAENIQKAADELGIDMKVETQGSIGAENELTAADIESADGIIIASDKDVSKERFAGKRLLAVGVQEGIRRPEELIRRFENDEVPVYKAGMKTADEVKDEKKRKENPIYRHLMNGVSYMIPFIVVGGLLIAIALTLGGEQTEGGIVIPDGSFWKQVEAIGGASFAFMVPILAGYIAYSIADRPGLAPGIVGGYIAANGSFYGTEANAGFIGGIIAGFLAGYIVLALKKIKVPKAMEPVMPIIFLPIIGTIIVGLLFIYVIGAPVSALFDGLTTWLEGMQGASSILLAIILGGMIAVDMGGPFNKVAFLFGVGMIAEGNYAIMGAIAVAICIPPIGMGLATFINRKKYNPAEIEAGKASFTMGLFGITEGAIPFAAQDPLRVIPSIVTGSMTGAVIAMLSGVGDHVAHGGPIVAVLGAVDNVLMFFVAAAVGVVVTAFMVNALKKTVSVEAAGVGEVAMDEEEEAPASEPAPSPEEKEETAEKPEVEKLTDIMDKDLIEVNLEGAARDAVIDELIGKLDDKGVLSSKESYKEAILAREAEGTTSMGMNIAIPHGKSDAVKHPAVVYGRSTEGVDWNSMDGTAARLIFMIAVPTEAAGDAHLKILQMLSRKLMDNDFRNELLEADSKEGVYELLEQVK
ncbi:PTS mannose transporter subunit IIABC [Salinicoccus sediminis]|uniref:PTS mannose transporter subunit IIABC n=1 Tax=Salinicoccus sediminis TaxID=1432562 RepID=A0A0M2SQS6_9STAP|nr:PTS fructose transporter subunit IIABC [Salinicoccus sediminis]KKK34970.1 PTS mannose transporter subunit IIABC [Salinicoccus sediminis]